MIVRQWRARAPKANAQHYIEHARRHVFAQLDRIAGNRGALVLRRNGGEHVDIVVLTLWDSMEAIEAFAGPTPQLAMVEPEAKAVLLDFDDTVLHYDLAACSGWPSAA